LEYYSALLSSSFALAFAASSSGGAVLHAAILLGRRPFYQQSRVCQQAMNGDDWQLSWYLFQ
jgi:hypothetical protein